jgi:mono/diheme cytochrome c family protein
MKLRRLHLTFVASYLTVLAVAMLAAGPGAAAQGGEGEAVDGAQVFQSICAACHQPDGQGLPGAFPPLVGHARELYEAAGGPTYLAYVVLFGLQGQITAAGQTFDGQMPSFYDLSDAQIAAVLDHVLTELGEAGQPEGYEPVTPEAVAAARKAALSPALVHQRRPELAAADGAQPGAELADAHYAAAQVERALPVYRRLCVECHGEDLGGGLIGGPPLAGAAFRQKWGGRPLSALFTFMSTQMPQGSPGSLTDQQYADLLALILSRNGHEAGDEPIVPDLEVLGGLQVKPN